MSRSCCVFVLLCFFAIYVLTIETSIISDNTITSVLNNPLTDDHRKILHAFTGYHHRFEQSANFKALRWNVRNLQIAGLCELCQIGDPFVSLFVQYKF
jgi:hypothetical protein